MLEIRKIQEGDMEFVKSNAFENAIKIYPKLTAPSDSFTCTFDNEIVAVGGIVDYWQGVGEAWLIMTKQSKKHDIFGIIAFSAIEKKLNELIVEHNLRRVEAGVRTDSKKAIRLIEALGFQKEGVKVRHTPDKCDMIMYARLI